MTRKPMALLSFLVLFGLVGTALYVASLLPPDAQLPTHWGANGEADQFSDKYTALLLPALIAVIASVVSYALPALETRRQGFLRSQGLYLWVWASLLLLSVAIEFIVVSVALGWDVPRDRLIRATIGIMFVLIGNQLGKSRSMYLMGIRTPWTLASEEIWIRTHRLGGKLMVGAGLLTVLTALLPLPVEVGMFLMIGLIVVASLVPVIYSYLLWRQGLGEPQARE